MKIAIVGAGPAGMSAAVRACEGGARVLILDDNPSAGGQIWRGETSGKWLENLANSGAELISGARIIAADGVRRSLLAETAHGAVNIGYDKLILATGARELFLPFPGWTLPNVMGVGGLQALVKSGLPVDGKRIVVAGSGPLLLSLAAYLRDHGAIVSAIAEQAGWGKLIRFGAALLGHPGKLAQAVSLRSASYSPGSWVVAAEGNRKLESVRLHLAGKTVSEQCDYLAVAYGFWPNVELAVLIGCEQQDGAVKVDELQQTSLEGVYSAGETTGIGGVDLSLVEGEIAGFASAGRAVQARKLFPARTRARRFASILNRTFALREELRALPDASTIVCRCEDVSLEKLKSADSWRSAKLHTRCGMGPCQGRICGPAVQFLFGWKAESIRPPVFPAKVSSLIEESVTK
jgi:NADPH-dependent 2,4-dienoyl-CoA reductase/sulfur reductase-like enzyme